MKIQNIMRMFQLFFIMMILLYLNACGKKDETNDANQSNQISLTSVSASESANQQNEDNNTKATEDISQLELDAERSLAADILQQTKILERDIVLFHWAKCSNIENYDDYDLRIKDSVRLMKDIVNQAWDLTGSASINVAGLGLYLARDPAMASIFYGDCLIKIKIPRGTRYVDVQSSRDVTSIRISDDTMQKLEKIQCVNDPYSTILSENNHMYYGRIRKSYACANVAMASLTALNISLINYGWSGRTRPLTHKVSSNCQDGLGGTFVLLDDKLLSEDETITIDSSVGTSKKTFRGLNDKEKKLVNIYKLYSWLDYNTKTDNHKISITLLKKRKYKEILQSYKRANIYKCGDISSEEDIKDIDSLKPSSEETKFFNALPEEVFKRSDRNSQFDNAISEMIWSKMRLKYGKSEPRETKFDDTIGVTSFIDYK